MSRSIDIQTPSGVKNVQLNQEFYTVESILDLDDNIIVIFNSIFSTNSIAELLKVLQLNNLLAPTNIDVLDESFVRLTMLDKNTIIRTGLTIGIDYQTLTFSQMLISLYLTNKLYDVLTSSINVPVVKSVPIPINNQHIGSFNKTSDKDFVQLGKALAEKLDPLGVPNIDIVYPVNGHIPIDSIIKRRKFINEYVSDGMFMGNRNMENITENDLKVIADLYDEIFFNGRIKKMLKKAGRTVQFELSGAKRAAGTCKTFGCEHTITISWPVFQDLFKSGSKDEHYETSGIMCYDKLECLQLTLEHELMHMIIQLSDALPKNIPPRDRVYSAHGLWFKSLVNAFYGHTAITHRLHHDQSTLPVKVDIKLNDVVSFVTKSGEQLNGIVLKLNPKTALILIDGGLKYKVDYSFLKKIEAPLALNIANAIMTNRKHELGKDDFKINDRVSFETKSAGTKSGYIIKLNPTRAVIVVGSAKYDSAYRFLTKI